MTDRFKQRLDEFNRALSRLENAVQQPQNEFTRDSVIRRFEFCYELSWKTMKLWLERKEIEVLNAKDTLREALSQKLILDGNNWSEVHRMRNLTSHTYDEALAKEVDAFIRAVGCLLFRELVERLKHEV